MKKKEKKLEDKTKVIKEEKMCKDLRKHALENLTPSKSGTIEIWEREREREREREIMLFQ